MAEIGDITGSGRSVISSAFAGVHAAERISGRNGANPETACRMSKTGNPHVPAVPAAAYRVAVLGITQPDHRRHCARQQPGGQVKMNPPGHSRDLPSGGLDRGAKLVNR